MTCTLAAYVDRPTALSIRHQLRKRSHLSVSVFQCELCDKYHLKANATKLRVSKSALKAAKLVALGYRYPEISAMMGTSEGTIAWYMSELKGPFGALSIPHLIAIMISLGVLNPKEFVPALEERHAHGNTRAHDHQRDAMQRDRSASVLQVAASG